MDSISILCDKFSRLPTEQQDDEIGKLFILLGGILIRKDPDETENDFRNRTFKKALDKLPQSSKYEGEFFDNIIIPSLINDFKVSSVNTQQRLMDKLSELADGLSITRNSDERIKDFRIRFYSRLLATLPPDSKCKMVEFAWLFDTVNESDEDSDEDESEGESYKSTPTGKQQSGLLGENQIQNENGNGNENENRGGLSHPMESMEIPEGEPGFNTAFIRNPRSRPPSPPPSSSDPPHALKKKHKKLKNAVFFLKNAVSN